MTPRNFPRSQAGVVLYIAMIFLVLLTVMAVTTFTVSKGTQQIVANQTTGNLKRSVAAQTIENAISSQNVIDTPLTPLVTAGGTFGLITSVDVNGDNKIVLKARMTTTATCTSGALKDSKSINLKKNPDLLRCIYSKSDGCYGVNFGFAVTATDTQVTNASSTVGVGAAVIMPKAQSYNICKDASGAPYL